ncbi:ClpP/crotonase-like domain-containing protein [Scheffersomyces xylosifermentans]|uniref:ClpP/crotonase-like domain-containing protein n=1 Tax=Scheffersomyces xylosifermentans TaxID=1304137 RepID=UPI00315D855A
MEGTDLLYEVKGKVTVITFNMAKVLNAFDGDQYLLLAKLVDRADKEEGTVMTLLQSSGRYFSAGANFVDKSIGSLKQEELFSHEYWLGRFVGRNAYITDLFHNHTKILAAAVNGPVVGLSTALLALCDLIYVKEEKDFFLLAPFANLGLVCEGASSSTLFLRLGWSKAAEALLLAKPISGKDLNKLGFINKTYDGQFSNTEDFNKAVLKELTHYISDLHEESIFVNKRLLKANRDQLISSSNAREVIQGFHKWIEGAPQSRFAQLSQGDIKHKF